MSIEQIKLIELIMFYKMKLNLQMKDMIAQIKDKKALKTIDMYIRQNHTTMNEEQLEKYLEGMLKQTLATKETN